MTRFLIIMRVGTTNEEHNGMIEAVQAREGWVEVRFFPRVVIGQTRQDSRDFEAAMRRQDGVSGVFTAPVRDPERLELDGTSLSAVKAWNLRQSPEYRSMKENQRGIRLPFNCGAKDVVPAAEMVWRSLPPSCRNTSQYMLGTVAVGIIIVDGPGAVAFTPSDRNIITAEVQEGMNRLIGLAPRDVNGVPRLTFIIDLSPVTLGIPDPAPDSEVDWRDPAMLQVGPGYQAEEAGLYDYLHDLRTTRWPLCPGPDWAYVAFFTKYADKENQNRSAWANIGGPRLVIPFISRGGYGLTDIDYQFAHETGHIFGAPDEYPKRYQCPPSYPNQWGYLREPNVNCEVTNPNYPPTGNAEDCFLRWGPGCYAICQHTVSHFGWRDSDNNNLPDPIDPAGPYGTDVGITPGTPFWNNDDLWIRNQDDGEADQSHENPHSNIDNYIYARVKNFGGVRAEIVRTSFFLANYTGTEFVYPNDYTNLINAPDTPCPTIFCLSPGGAKIAKVHLRPAQIPPTTWHPCLLVHVSCAQEGSVPVDSHVWDSNNLAQKNLVIDYVAPAQTMSLAMMAQNSSARQPFFEFKASRRFPGEVKLAFEFRDPHFTPEVIEPSDVVLKQRWGRVFLPVPSDRRTKFKLPLQLKTRKTIGLSFTAPPDARIGDEYHLELIQYNERLEPTGGITFVIRVAHPRRVLSEQRWRTAVLRELGRHLQSPQFNALADAADALIESQFDQDGEIPGDPTATRETFSQILRGIAVPETWSYPVEGLIEMLERIRTRPGLVTDLNALSLVLFYAQERLLVEHETR